MERLAQLQSPALIPLSSRARYVNEANEIGRESERSGRGGTAEANEQRASLISGRHRIEIGIARAQFISKSKRQQQSARFSINNNNKSVS